MPTTQDSTPSTARFYHHEATDLYDGPNTAASEIQQTEVLVSCPDLACLRITEHPDPHDPLYDPEDDSP